MGNRVDSVSSAAIGRSKHISAAALTLIFLLGFVSPALIGRISLELPSAWNQKRTEDASGGTNSKIRAGAPPLCVEAVQLASVIRSNYLEASRGNAPELIAQISLASRIQGQATNSGESELAKAAGAIRVGGQIALGPLGTSTRRSSVELASQINTPDVKAAVNAIAKYCG